MNHSTASATDSSARIIGIDLGTTRSVMAQLDSFDRPQTIVNAEGSLTTPSVVLFDGSSVLVGKEALKALATTPDRVVQFVKREMGNREFVKTIDGTDYPAELIQSFILGKLRHDAEQSLGEPVGDVVITVPAFFNEPKRRATMDAGLLAGLNVTAVINEPTAAALAFGAASGRMDASGAFVEPETILVYDLGGGTFDVSLLKIDGDTIHVLGVDGNARLGGVDWDQCLADWLAEQLILQHGLDREQLDSVMPTLLSEAEDLKQTLSARKQAVVRLRVLDRALQTEITRDQFEEMTAHLLDRTRFTLRKLLQEAATSWDQVDRILLVGGATRMPQVGEMLQRISNVSIDRSVSPDEAVAHGAAVYSSILAYQLPAEAIGRTGSSKSIQVVDVNAHNLGVLGVEPSTQRPQGHVIIPKNTPLPARRAARFKTVRKNQRSVVVQVIEGGDRRGLHATKIGRFVVGGLPTGLPAGSPVDVIMSYDRDGIINAQAIIRATGHRASVRLERASNLTTAQREQWADRTQAIHTALGLE